MLREFRVNYADAPSALFKADAAMKVGMGVVKNYADGTADLPSAATAENIFLVYKMPYPTGRDTAFENFSDYYAPFNDVAEGEPVVLYSYRADSAFGTDQFDDTAIKAATVPLYVAVGTDGKWTAAASNAASRYYCDKMYDDAGHTLAHIEVLETAGTNS